MPNYRAVRNKNLSCVDRQPGSSELLKGGVGSLPGQIVSTTKQWFAVAAVNGAILVKRVQVEGSARIPSPEFAKQTYLRTGDRLGE